jgi:hypothetical protein
LLKTTFHWPFAEIPGHLLKTTFRQRAALAIKRVSSLMLYLVVRVYHSPFPAKTCAVRWRWWVQVQCKWWYGHTSEDLRQRTCFVVPTWRTGQQEFKAFMKQKVPACNVYV